MGMTFLFHTDIDSCSPVHRIERALSRLTEDVVWENLDVYHHAIYQVPCRSNGSFHYRGEEFSFSLRDLGARKLALCLTGGTEECTRRFASQLVAGYCQEVDAEGHTRSLEYSESK